jgi:hypothetical protein
MNTNNRPQQNNNRRRGRNNNNNRQQNNNRSGFDYQNQIDNRARGNAAQMLEKYKKLAQDAQFNGDRVNAEYHLQFADHYFRVRQMNGPDGAVRDYHFDLNPTAFIPETPPTDDAVISDVFFTADLLQHLMIRRRHAHVFTGADPSIKYCLLHIEYESPGGCNVDVRAAGETVQKDQYGPSQSIILRPTSLIYDPGVLRIAVSTRTGLEPFRGYTACDAL